MRDSIKNPVSPEAPDDREEGFLQDIARLDAALLERCRPVMFVDPALNRKLVSFQANKNRAFYRWYKYKEGFSAALVEYYLRRRAGERTKTLLDPFAGSGAALFGASEAGIDAIGIELLPIGRHLIRSRDMLNRFSPARFDRLILWRDDRPWVEHPGEAEFSQLKITRGAYPPETALLIRKYLSRMQEEEEEEVRGVLLLALCCVLEGVSYTRKDGQYLRWDQRSGRCLGAKPFTKGVIRDFNGAIREKLGEIIADVRGDEDGGLLGSTERPPASPRTRGTIRVLGGSCLQVLPGLEADSVDMVITSPPYCNRYDYTRTYALELAMLGLDEPGVAALRQEMLSCTVENREKDLLALNPAWEETLKICRGHALLQGILDYLHYEKEAGKLNNNGIPRMVRGYFYELACVIRELHRALTPGGQVIMVNDNVRYAGAGISCDLILSDLAAQIGFRIEEIAVLPIGKGNSSQQMGKHGREALRKCVYIWRKP